MSEPYASMIWQIAATAIHNVKAAGYDPRQCVWEISPSIRRIMRNTVAQEPHTSADAHLGKRDFLMGVPIREGVTDESTGLLLKRVNLSKWE